jgi:hypothetical protein
MARTSSPPPTPLPPPQIPRWWQWLSSPLLLQQASRYAGLLTGVNLLAWLVVGGAGGDIFDRRLPLVMIPLNAFVMWLALATYRRRRDTEMGFGRGLRLGATIAALASVAIATLLSCLVLLGGDGLRQRHIDAKLRALAELNERTDSRAADKATYNLHLTEARTVSAGLLFIDELLLRRLLPGLLTALLGAIFLRKANAEGAEPERAPRPAKEDDTSAPARHR